MNRNFRILAVILFFTLAIGSFYSCRAPRSVSVIKIKSLSAAKILKNLNAKPSGFDKLTIKRINCQISGSSINASFRAGLKLIRDKKVLISFSKLNIPVGRILLTPDSVKYVNYLDKQYLKGDYKFIYNVLGLNIDFQDIQALIFNNIFSYFNNPDNNDFEDFVAFTDSGHYVLQSVNNRKLSKFYQKWNSGKTGRFLKRKNEEALVVQSVYIEPDRFNILRIIFEDKTNGQRAEFDFGEFSDVEGRDYPGSIDISFVSQEEKLLFNIRLNGFSVEDSEDFDLKIPDKYIPVVLKSNY